MNGQPRPPEHVRVDGRPLTSRNGYLVLACPVCARTVAVLAGCSAWCTHCPGRPEMEETGVVNGLEA